MVISLISKRASRVLTNLVRITPLVKKPYFMIPRLATVLKMRKILFSNHQISTLSLEGVTMKLPISWLKDYIDLDGLSVEEIARKLTLAGLEVEEIKYAGLPMPSYKDG